MCLSVSRDKVYLQVPGFRASKDLKKLKGQKQKTPTESKVMQQMHCNCLAEIGHLVTADSDKSVVQTSTLV